MAFRPVEARHHKKPGTTRTRAAETNTKTDLAAETDLAAKIDLAVKTGPSMIIGPPAKTDTIAKTTTRKAEEKRGAEGKKTPFCYFHGKDQGHWTNECPIAIKRRQSSNAKMHNQQNQ